MHQPYRSNTSVSDDFVDGGIEKEELETVVTRGSYTERVKCRSSWNRGGCDLAGPRAGCNF
jgi:hypothetical protein